MGNLVKLADKKPDTGRKISRLLNFSIILFYVCLVILWFKDNVQPLKKIDISYLYALVPLGITGFIQILLRVKRKNINLHFRFTRVFWAAFILILIALAFRIPFLLHSFALMSSDHAIPALMAKHISEGKLPPVYYYGQFYMGSLSQHVFALMFAIFGYSILLLKFTTLLFYLAFIVLQFVFMKNIFSFRSSFVVSLFYCLPIGRLVAVSFDNTGAFSLVLLLGSSVLYLTYLISWKHKKNLVPLLGFVGGISFWTHQIMICFILTSLSILSLKGKLILKKYMSLFFFFILGGLPLIILEIFQKFRLTRYLISGPGEIEATFFEKLKTTIGLTNSLISREHNASSIIFFVLLLSGFLTWLYLSFRRRELLPQSVFSVFLFFFYLVYLFSGFSSIPANRYLYPLYFCLPVLLVSVFGLLKSGRQQQVLSLSLILIVFFVYNSKQSYADFLAARDSHHRSERILASMRETGEEYWRGNYWTAYFLTALSGEDIIVDSDTVNRYYPYSLLYYNESPKENFVFLRGAGSLERDRAVRLLSLLDSLGAHYEKKEMGDAWLVYGVSDPVFEKTFKVPVPSKSPDLSLTQISSSEGYLNLDFQNNGIEDGLEFRINVEIPGYSSTSKRLMSHEKETRLRIPYPRNGPFKIKYYVDYQRLVIRSSIRELFYTAPENDRDEQLNGIVYLKGFPPLQIDIHGKKMRICEKVARLEIAEVQGRKIRKIRLYLHSPFEFSHPYWYGDYDQKVSIEINGSHYADKILNEGDNVIEIEQNSKSFFAERRPNTIALRFAYHFPFSFTPIWRTSVLLERIEIE